MSEVSRFALLGLGTGSMYALLALGIVLIYRGSGVVNLSQGAIGIVGAYVYYELHSVRGHGLGVAVTAGIVTAALLGVGTHWCVMRPLRGSSSLVRLVATLGILLFVQAGAVLRYGNEGIFVESALPDEIVAFTDTIRVSQDRLWLVAIALALCLSLYCLYRWTAFGLATSAVAENERAAAAQGWSPDLVASVNWALGGALGGLAAILIVPITSLSTGSFTTLTTYALAAALVGGFASFPLTVAAGLAIGVLQSWTIRYSGDITGLVESLPFVIILAVLIVRGRGLPMRGTRLDRLPAVSSGRVTVARLVVPLVVLFGVSAVVDRSWINAITTSMTMAVVLLSIVVLTGYAGQLSLGQYALAGLGAFICGRLDAAFGVPLPLAFTIAVVSAIPIGIAFGVPALRTRGVNLAILTLVLGVAVSATIFFNFDWTGAFGYDDLSSLSIFGISVSPITHPERYLWLVVACYVILAVVIGNIRRSRIGRRLLAIRTNERAAAALGIGVLEGKLFAFVFATGIAMIGGILIAYQRTTVMYDSFGGSFTSILLIALAVIGGVGYLGGPLFGATLVVGGVGAKIGNELFSDEVSRYLPLLTGGLFVAMLLQDPNGLAEAHYKIGKRIKRLTRSEAATIAVGGSSEAPDGSRTSAERESRARDDLAAGGGAEEAVLSVEGITVRFGGVTAVDSVSFEVRSGQIVGLIGPNGAGKTTAIDAITGFVKPAAGTLRLNGQTLDKMSASMRARAGLSRSFQSLELFEDMTVRENLLAACDGHDRLGYLTAMVRPDRQALPSHVMTSVREFRLENDLDQPVEALSYARRRLVAIARAAATRPKILLLDEPAAGLSDSESVELMHLVRRLADTAHIGILVVEHDMQFVMGLCDDVVVLDFGRKIAHASPDDVVLDPAVRAAYLGYEEDELVPSGKAV